MAFWRLPRSTSSRSPLRSPAQPAAHSMSSPLYCDRSGLSLAERTRHFDVLGPVLVPKRQAVHELVDGYEFQFPADKDTYEQLAEFIEVERRCCPFFDISLPCWREPPPVAR